MHRGDICNRGLNCNIFSGNRDLADFISVTVDADGNANAVWTDDASQSRKAIMFGKQIGGGDHREAAAEVLSRGMRSLCRGVSSRRRRERGGEA